MHGAPAEAFSNGHHFSQPATPGSRSRFPPQTSHTSHIYKQMSFPLFAQTPPLEFIEPIGQGPQFHFTRPQSRGASTDSGRGCATTPGDSEDDDDDDESDEESTHEEVQLFRRVDEADITFVLEELDSDTSYDSDIEVVRPDNFEDAKSDRSDSRPEGNGFIEKFKDFTWQGSSDEEEQQRRYRRKRRWSAGVFRRSHSQSVEGNSSYSDNDPLDDVESTARRLRRRVRGPGDRASLVFEDRGFPNANNIVEVEELEDDSFTLDELPFW
ncbi:hypothetical protein CC80DRAFT_417755, partial [Byssothecium circinans]